MKAGFINDTETEIIDPLPSTPPPPAPKSATQFPAEDLEELLGRLQKRELELEAQNLELRQASAGDEAVDSASLGCVVVNEKGVIRRINRAGAALLGAEHEAAAGADFFKFIPAGEADKFRAQLLHCHEEGARVSTELRIEPPDREPVELQILCLSSPVKTGERQFRLFLADVTPIKRAHSKILRLSAFPTFSPNPVMEFGEDGTLIWRNDAAQELTRALGAAHPSEIVPQDIRQLVAQCLATGESLLRQETVLGNRHIFWSFFPILPSRVVHCYGTDITERIRLEAQTHQTQRLESVGQLAANVAHDFNNIITIIQGYTSLLLSQRELPADMNDPLHQISTATERATHLTRQLMIFSRKNRVEPRLLDLNELVQSFGYLLRRVLGEDVAQQFNFASSLPAIQADPGMMEQIITNLAINARDAMPKGGKLLLETSVVELGSEDARRNPEARAGKFVCLTVNDTGAGMTQETMSKIFEPFFTTKQTGVGLGLSAVYGIVKQHQGWIEVSSVLGQGSTFKVFLPVVPPKAELKPPPEPTTVGGTETILVVEDEPALRELSVRQLRKLGYRILQASTGTEALSIWQQNPDSVDLLFTDMVMPDGMTGRELAETLLTQKPGLKVIYTSGYSLEVVEQDFALRKGVNFLQKPYPTPALAKTIRALLDS